MPPATDGQPWRERLLGSILVVAIPTMLGALLLTLATMDRSNRSYWLLPVPLGVVGLVAVSRRRLPFELRAAALIAPLAFGACITYLRLGFKGNASALVTFIVVLTGLLLGRRKMTAVVLVAFAVAAGIGAAMSLGLLPADPSRVIELDRPLAWIRNDLVALLIWVAVGSAVVFVIEHIEGALRATREALGSLQAEQERRADAERGRHAAQEALVRAQRTALVSELAAGVAHDFNDVLSVISNWSTASLNETASAGDREAARRAFGSALRQGQALTRQLTALARPEAHRVTPFSLDRPASSAVETLQLAMPPNIELSFATYGVPRVEADETEIQQVVYNLVLNARDAMPGGGSIEVAIGLETRADPITVVGGSLPPGRWATLGVGDSGPGIVPALRERIFELFFTTKTPEEGTGLGLATVARIARSRGGGVALETEVGHGATFTVYLPCV
jgi:signal transduction histidine kinase